MASGSNSAAVGANAQATADGSVALGAGSVADRANTVSVGTAGAERQVTHVATGTAATDAVNVSQLNTGINQLQEWSRNYTDQRFASIEHNVNEVDDRANAGTASAYAMASMPQAYRPNQNSLGVGVGSFHGESAIAVGMSTITESGRYILKINASANTNGDAGVGAGAGIVW